MRKILELSHEEENYKLWHPQDHIIFKWLGSKPIKAGTKFHSQQIMMGRGVTYDGIIESCQPNHLIRLTFDLFGLSMGGWFATRAAAYEKRIRALIVSGHAVDYYRIPPAFARALMMFFVNHFRKMTTNSFEKVAAKDDINAWKTSNLAHITQLDPIKAFEYSLNLSVTSG